MPRPTCGQLEQRDAPFTDNPPTVEGQRLRGLIPYSVESREMGDGWREVMSPRCLANADMSELIATVDHGGLPLGRYPSTLHVEDGPNGLGWSVDLPESRSDIREAVERGDVRAGSWRMIVARDHWVGDVRHVDEVRALRDVCVAGSSLAAYPDAAVEYRTEETPAAPSPPVGAPRPGSLRVEDRSGGGQDADAVLGQIESAIVTAKTGEVRTLTDAISLTPTALGVVLFDKLRASAVVLRSGIRILDMPQSKAITYPTITADAQPATYAEGAAITPGDPTFGTVTATARKIAHLIQLDNEVIDDSNPAVQPILTQHLLTMLGLALDKQLLSGSGTPPDIKGMANITGIQTIAAGANGAQATLDVFADAFALLEALSIPTEEIRVVMHPRNAATLRKIKASTAGTYLWGEPQEATADRPVFGVRWFASAQLDATETQGTAAGICNSAYVYSAERVIFARRSSPELILDRSRLFNSDQSELRATMRGDLICPTPNAIVRITGLLA